MTRARRPAAGEHAPYYGRYVALVPDGDVVATLESEGRRLAELLEGVPADLETHAYDEGKWSVREVVGHVVDCERMFGYRAVHIARGDPAPLPDMDEKVWAAGSNAGARPLEFLVAELRAVRASTVALFRGLDDDAWDRTGVASNRRLSVRALAWIAAGHAEHHRRILEERYGVGSG